MLRIVDVILVLIRDLVPVVDAIGRHDGALARQLRDALNSARRTNHYAIAVGSAREAFIALRAAEAWRYIEPLSPELHDAFNRVIGTLVKNIARR